MHPAPAQHYAERAPSPPSTAAAGHSSEADLRPPREPSTSIQPPSQRPPQPASSMDTARSETNAKDRVKQDDLPFRQLITKKGKEVADPLRCQGAAIFKSQPQGVKLMKKKKKGRFLEAAPIRIASCYCHVIGTSTKVDTSGVDVDKYVDKYFTKEAKRKQKKGEGEFFEVEKEEKEEDDQKTVDARVVKRN